MQSLGCLFVAGSEAVRGIEWEDVEVAASAVATELRSSTPPVQCAACSAAADLYGLLNMEPMKYVTCDMRRQLVVQVGGMAERDSTTEVRIAALMSAKKLVTGSDRGEVVAVLAPALIVCATESNRSISLVADRVMRRAFVVRGDGAVNKKMVQAAKSELEADGTGFIDRRVVKVLEMADSDDEGGGETEADDE
jgi:hypothetical protein